MPTCPPASESEAAAAAAGVRFVFRRRQDLAILRELGPADAPSVRSVTLVERSCFSNCLRLLPHMEAIAGRQLYVIAGSLGLCDPLPIYYEWGGYGSEIHERAVDFIKCRVTGSADVHFWLSSSEYGEDGIVYDVLDPHITECVARVAQKRIRTESFMYGCGIIGRAIGDLERDCGLKYVAAAPIVQEVLARRHSGRLQKVDV